jgi:hypothetical protein
MNKKSLLLALVLGLPLMACAGPSILISALDHRAVGARAEFSGGVRAMIKDGTTQTTITAAKMSFEGNRLDCWGDVRIEAGGQKTEALEVTITFATLPDVYRLNPAAIVLNGTSVPGEVAMSASTDSTHLSKAVPFALPEPARKQP